MSETDYDRGRKAIEVLAPLVSEHGGGKEFAVLVDMVDALKPKDEQTKPTLPEGLQGPRATSALTLLQLRFRKAVGINVFDTAAEELVRATWSLVHCIVRDEKDRLREEYRNSGIFDTPDLDTATKLADDTRIPPMLHALLWDVQSKGRQR